MEKIILSLQCDYCTAIKIISFSPLYILKLVLVYKNLRKVALSHTQGKELSKLDSKHNI